METALAQQVARNRQLDEDLQKLCSSASTFGEYSQARYDRLHIKYEKEIKQSDAFRGRGGVGRTC